MNSAGYLQFLLIFAMEKRIMLAEETVAGFHNNFGRLDIYTHKRHSAMGKRGSETIEDTRTRLVGDVVQSRETRPL